MNFANFAHGETRLVLLVGNVAIKSARFPCFLLIRRGFFWLKKGKLLERPRELHGSVLVGVLKYILRGIMENTDEYHFYKEYSHLPLAPTLFSLFGLANIQVRGEPILASELADCPFREMAKTQPELHLRETEQFCRINGVIVLVDYGNPLFQKALRKRYARATAYT